MGIVPELLKQYYREKVKFRSEEARLSRRETFERFIDYTFESGEVEINIAPTAAETREILSREIDELPVPDEYITEREIREPDEIEEYMDVIRRAEPAYIIHELPRPSVSGIPYRMMLNREGSRYWIDILGGQVPVVDFEELPIRPFVPEFARPIEPFPETKQHLVRQIQLREFKIDSLHIMAQEAMEIGDIEGHRGINRRIGSYRGWQTRIRRKLTE